MILTTTPQQPFAVTKSKAPAPAVDYDSMGTDESFDSDFECFKEEIGGVDASWSVVEDSALEHLVTVYGTDFANIAKAIRTKSRDACEERWNRTRNVTKKGAWDEYEDKILTRHASVFVNDAKTTNSRMDWSRVAKYVPNRTGKQCRERWINHLNPDIIRSDWTDEEDERLMYLVDLFPKKWATISRQITGRTENMVKIRYYSIIRKQKREEKQRLKALKIASSNARKKRKRNAPLVKQSENKPTNTIVPTTKRAKVLAHKPIQHEQLPVVETPLAAPAPFVAPQEFDFSAFDFDDSFLEIEDSTYMDSCDLLLDEVTHEENMVNLEELLGLIETRPMRA